MPFDPDKYLAKKATGASSSFNPDTYLAKKGSSSGPSEWESALRGAAQGASFGFADEIAGGLESAFTDKPYEQARDESRAAYKAAVQANPNSYMAGNFAGGAATAAVPGLAGVRGAAIAGGLTGLGGSESDSVADMAKDAAVGAGIGGALGAAGEKVAGLLSKGRQAVSEGLSDFAENRAFKALQPTKKVQDLAQARDKVNAIGREALDSGIVSPLASVDDMAPRIEAQLARKGQELGAVRKAADEAGAKVDLSGLTDDALRNADEAVGMGANETAKARAYMDEISAITGKPVRTVEEAAQLEKALGEAAQFNKLTGSSPKNDAARLARQRVQGLSDAVIEGAVPDRFDDYLLNRELYSQYKTMQGSVQDAMSRNSRNRTFGLTDYVAAAANPGSTLTSAATAVANKVARERGNATLAYSADWVAKKMASDPARFGKYSSVLSNAMARGGNALASTHFLLQQSDPQYRELVRQQNEEGNQ